MTTIKLKHGDCLEVLRQAPTDYADSLVTDPPAGIGFMGKNWDSDKGGRDAWIAWLTEVMTECHRVLKPGGHALVWAIPRTSHWTMTALEDAGFEIRDVVTHLFGTGFPKSLDVSKAIDKEAGAERKVVGKKPYKLRKSDNSIGEKSYGVLGGFGPGQYIDGDITAPATDAARQWEGFGTALKPACEFWVLCRKPLSEKTVAKNVLKHGTGALNIDASRIGTEERTVPPTGTRIDQCEGRDPEKFAAWQAKQQPKQVTGRFPANLILDEEAAAALDEQSGQLSQCGSPKKKEENRGASRFFYVAKASKSDRGEANSHPTVKSTALMEYLIKLITPPGGLVLDPFMGSGSTGVAAVREGFGFVGIEKEKEYYDIAVKRLEYAE